MNTLVDWLLSLTPHGAPFFDTYAWLINTAIYTTVTALFIILFKLIFKNKIKARWHFLIWAILLIRLVVPVLPSAPISVFNAVRVEESVIEHSSYQTIVTPPNTRADDPDSQYPVAQAPHSESNGFVSFTEGDKPGESVTILNTDRIVLCIWLGGTVILLGYFITVLAVYRRRLKKRRSECDEKTLSILNACKEKLGIKRNVRLYFADTTPVLIGLFKPSIYIPDNYSESELEAVIIHELCHMKHLDVLWSGVAAAVLCLNWYNPIIWVSFFMFKRDIEVYCDERTLKYLDDKQSYAMLLLKTATKKKYVLGTSSLQSGKSDVKRRIKYLAKFKKPKVLIIVIAVVLAALISVVCLTNASAKQFSDSSEQSFRYEVVENSVTKYIGEKEAWSTNIIEESDPTSESYGSELDYAHTTGNDKIKLFFGGLYSTTYRVDEQDQHIGFITAVDAESGNILFSKEFTEFANYKNSNEDTSYRGFISAATIRRDGNIDVFHIQSTYTEGFEPGYETTLITLNQKGEIINQSKFNTGEMRYFDSVCETDDGYAVCGYDKNHNPDYYIVAKANNKSIDSQIQLNLFENNSVGESKRWNFENPQLWSINGKVYFTTSKEDSDILGKYAAYDPSGSTDYSNVLQDEKDGNFASFYSVDFENSKAEPYDISQCISASDLFTDESGNIYYRVIKITAEDAQYSFPVSNEPFENCEYWIYVFDRDGKPINNYSANTPAKTYLPFEVVN